jgi:hypothetical protein
VRGQAYLRTPVAVLLGTGVVAGSLLLWVGLPVMGLWVVGELTSTASGFLAVALIAIPAAMALFGALLYRLGDLYERMSGDGRPSGGGRSAWLVSATDERGSARRARAPRPLIDVAMTFSATVALVLMAVWFFVFAHSPLAPLP